MSAIGWSVDLVDRVLFVSPKTMSTVLCIGELTMAGWRRISALKLSSTCIDLSSSPTNSSSEWISTEVLRDRAVLDRQQRVARFFTRALLSHQRA